MAEVRKEAPEEAVGLVGLIRLDVVVRNAAGETVTGLGREDFTVLDNGQPRRIAAFRPSLRAAGHREAPGEASVVVLLDTLALPARLATEEREQVLAFLRADGGRLADPVTVYTLEDQGFFLTATASRDGNALAAAVEANGRKDLLFSPPTVKASFLDEEIEPAFTNFPPMTGIRALATIAAAEDTVPGRKVLLWVGPGLRNAGTGAYPDEAYRRLADAKLQMLGTYTPPDLRKAFVQRDVFDKVYWFLTLLRQAGITVDVFSEGERAWGLAYAEAVRGQDVQKGWMRVVDAWKPYATPPDVPEHGSWMDLYKKVLAVESGGRVLARESDLAQQMAECVRGADTYYTLTFDPPAAGHADAYHALEVKVRPGLTVETVEGYYDEPFYDDPPDGGARRMTAEELEAALRGAGGEEQVRLLQQTALARRLSQPERTRLEAEVRGGDAREALRTVASIAEFAPPPDDEVVADPAPSAAEQQQMLGRVEGYLEQTIPRLPDFFAVRQTERFDSAAAYHEVSTNTLALPLHRIEESKAGVLYRGGMEMVNGHARAAGAAGTPLFTYGTFGPMLKTASAVLGYRQGMTWGWWERGATGRAAVFRFAVPATGPHYLVVVGCCVPDQAGSTSFQDLPGYRGEMAIDPATGAILRIAVEADLASFDPVEWSDILVEYGPVTIGEKTYILPERSVSLWRGRALPALEEWNLRFRTWGPEETRMNLFTFGRYHMFHGSARILPGFEPAPDAPQ